MFNDCNCNHNCCNKCIGNYCKKCIGRNNKSSYPKWDTLAYYNETKPPKGIDTLAPSWPLCYFKINTMGYIIDLSNRMVNFDLKNPINIDYKEELDEVVEMQNYLKNSRNHKYVDIAKFWGTGVPVNQWTPIALQLISSYKVTPPMSARILNALQSTINDSFIICWHYKYLYNCPRPCQLDHNLKTVLDTPRFPAYISGHSVVSGACEVILSYYFPREAKKLHSLAEDASISRLYGGIHFSSDLVEGLKLGRKIGHIVVEILKKDYDSQCNPVDYIYTDFVNAPIMPSYYEK